MSAINKPKMSLADLKKLKGATPAQKRQAVAEYDELADMEGRGELRDPKTGHAGSVKGDPERWLLRKELEDAMYEDMSPDEVRPADLGAAMKANAAAVVEDEFASSLLLAGVKEFVESKQKKRDFKTRRADPDRSFDGLLGKDAGEVLEALKKPMLTVDGLEGTGSLLWATMRALEGVMHRCSNLAFYELRRRSSARLFKLEKVRAPAPDAFWTECMNSWLGRYENERFTADEDDRWTDFESDRWGVDDAWDWELASDFQLTASLMLVHKALYSLWLGTYRVDQNDMCAYPDEFFGYMRFESAGRWNAYSRLKDAYQVFLKDLDERFEAREAQKRETRTALQRMFA